MANIKANEKHNKQSIKRNAANKSFKSKIKTAIKKAETTKEAADINQAVKLINEAWSKGIYKKNKAARYTSKMHKLNA